MTLVRLSFELFSSDDKSHNIDSNSGGFHVTQVSLRFNSDMESQVEFW